MQKVRKKLAYSAPLGVMSGTYEQAIQGLFTAGTSDPPDPYKTVEEGRKEKVGCKRGIEDIDRCCITNSMSIACLIPGGIKFQRNERYHW